VQERLNSADARTEHERVVGELEHENANKKGLAEALEKKIKELENQCRLSEEAKADLTAMCELQKLELQELKSTKVFCFLSVDSATQ
jgi:hypothetical protein